MKRWVREIIYGNAKPNVNRRGQKRKPVNGKRGNRWHGVSRASVVLLCEHIGKDLTNPAARLALKFAAQCVASSGQQNEMVISASEIVKEELLDVREAVRM